MSKESNEHIRNITQGVQGDPSRSNVLLNPTVVQSKLRQRELGSGMELVKKEGSESGDKYPNKKQEILHPLSSTNLGLNSVQVHNDDSTRTKFLTKKPTNQKTNKQIKPPPKRTTNMFKNNKAK